MIRRMAARTRIRMERVSEVPAVMPPDSTGDLVPVSCCPVSPLIIITVTDSSPPVVLLSSCWRSAGFPSSDDDDVVSVPLSSDSLHSIARSDATSIPRHIISRFLPEVVLVNNNGSASSAESAVVLLITFVVVVESKSRPGLLVETTRTESQAIVSPVTNACSKREESK